MTEMLKGIRAHSARGVIVVATLTMAYAPGFALAAERPYALNEATALLNTKGSSIAGKPDGSLFLEEGEQPVWEIASADPGDAQWVLLRDAQTPARILNIEAGAPELSEIALDWWSGHWKIEAVSPGKVRLVNRWQGDKALTSKAVEETQIAMGPIDGAGAVWTILSPSITDASNQAEAASASSAPPPPPEATVSVANDSSTNSGANTAKADEEADTSQSENGGPDLDATTGSFLVLADGSKMLGSDLKLIDFAEETMAPGWLKQEVEEGVVRLAKPSDPTLLLNNQEGALAVSAISPDWWSAQWQFEPGENGAATLINRWKGDQILGIEGGKMALVSNSDARFVLVDRAELRRFGFQPIPDVSKKKTPEESKQKSKSKSEPKETEEPKVASKAKPSNSKKQVKTPIIRARKAPADNDINKNIVKNIPVPILKPAGVREDYVSHVNGELPEAVSEQVETTVLEVQGSSDQAQVADGVFEPVESATVESPLSDSNDVAASTPVADGVVVERDAPVSEAFNAPEEAPKPEPEPEPEPEEEVADKDPWNFGWQEEFSKPVRVNAEMRFNNHASEDVGPWNSFIKASTENVLGQDEFFSVIGEQMGQGEELRALRLEAKVPLMRDRGIYAGYSGHFVGINPSPLDGSYLRMEIHEQEQHFNLMKVTLKDNHKNETGVSLSMLNSEQYRTGNDGVRTANIGFKANDVSLFTRGWFWGMGPNESLGGEYALSAAKGVEFGGSSTSFNVRPVAEAEPLRIKGSATVNYDWDRWGVSTKSKVGFQYVDRAAEWHKLMALGGRGFAMGYPSAEAAGEIGVGLSLEVARPFEIDIPYFNNTVFDGKLTPFAYVDAAHVNSTVDSAAINGETPFLRDTTLVSGALGLRYDAEHWGLEFAWATPLAGDSRFEDATSGRPLISGYFRW